MVSIQWGTFPNKHTESGMAYSMKIMQCYATVLGSDWPTVILLVTWDSSLKPI